MIKKILAAGAVLALLLVGCGVQEQASAESPGGGGFFEEKYHKLPDGRTVLCLYKEGHIGGYSSGTAPAMDCDWAGAIVHVP